MPLRVMFQVTPATIAELHNPPHKDWLYLDKNQPWFADRWLLSEAPRSQAINDAILEGTVAIGLWSDEQGAIVKTFPDVASAERAKAGARVVLSVDVDVPDEAPAPRKGKAVDVESGAVAV